jgi:hypothetical protein
MLGFWFGLRPKWGGRIVASDHNTHDMIKLDGVESATEHRQWETSNTIRLCPPLRPWVMFEPVIPKAKWNITI